MLLVLWTQKGFCEDVGCLLGISTTLYGYQLLLDEFLNPMPSDCNMFASIMELLVLGHHNRTIVVAFDNHW
jgi:hypothetical protein